jgi:ElaB/YqjD/DUF883 family membrane-anchored ribosome-binding protein
MSNEFSNFPHGIGSPSQTVRRGEILTPGSGDPPALGDLKDKVMEDISAARDTIKETADAAIDTVKETASEQTKFAARKLGAIASALEKVGSELEQSDSADVGRYTKQIGTRVQTLANQMEGKDIGEVATMAEDFGRKQPLAFLGIAAVAGLAASRFLTASSKRSASPGRRHADSNGRSGSLTTGGDANG